jgi:hypothetical protein
LKGRLFPGRLSEPTREKNNDWGQRFDQRPPLMGGLSFERDHRILEA